jgi:hypothetical protein
MAVASVEMISVVRRTIPELSPIRVCWIPDPVDEGKNNMI